MADMIGAVVHLTGDPAATLADHRSDWLYSQYRDVGPTGGPGWLALMAQAGFRHARCDTGGAVAPGTSPAQRAALETMRLMDRTKPAFSPPYVLGIDKTYLSGPQVGADLPILDAAGGRIWMIEGPDEAWLPNGKFLPSYVTDGPGTFMCLHAMPCATAIAPAADPTRWAPCRDRGQFSPAVAYRPGDIVSFGGHQWVAPPTFEQPAGTWPGPDWWDLTAWAMPTPFSATQPGIYSGYDQAGEVGLAWGELIEAALAADDRAGDGRWLHAGRAGGPTRVATLSEGGMDIYFYWSPTGDDGLLPRYRTSMPGGATNVHLYASGQPTDVAAICHASAVQANIVLPGYAIYLGEIGQATYPTDDALALGGSVSGATPAAVTTTSGHAYIVDSGGRPMPGTSTGRFGAEQAQAQTITRSWVELFAYAAAGSRLAVYELLNEPFNAYGDYAGQWGYPASGGPYMDYDRSEGNFGLLRNDFRPKPAFVAIANTCRLMGDAGDQTFTPMALTYTIDRAGPPRASAVPSLGAFDAIDSVLTQASDGTFRIPVWYRNVRATKALFAGLPLNEMVTPPPTDQLRLTVPAPLPRRIEAYNTQVSAVDPIVAVDASSTISWTHTADLWVVKVYLGG